MTKIVNKISDLLNGEHRAKVKALEPDFKARKAESGKTLFVGLDGIWAHHIFNRAAFLADLQLAVSVGTFEIVVQIDQQLVGFLIRKHKFFRQDQNATRANPA